MSGFEPATVPGVSRCSVSNRSANQNPDVYAQFRVFRSGAEHRRHARVHGEERRQRCVSRLPAHVDGRSPRRRRHRRGLRSRRRSLRRLARWPHDDGRIGGDQSRSRGARARCKECGHPRQERRRGACRRGPGAGRGTAVERGNAALDAGVVDLRGSGSPTAVCLHVGGADLACSNPFAVNALDDASSGALPGYAGSAVISGKWYVFVAANAAPSIGAA